MPNEYTNGNKITTRKKEKKKVEQVAVENFGNTKVINYAFDSVVNAKYERSTFAEDAVYFGASANMHKQILVSCVCMQSNGDDGGGGIVCRITIWLELWLSGFMRAIHCRPININKIYGESGELSNYLTKLGKQSDIPVLVCCEQSSARNHRNEMHNECFETIPKWIWPTILNSGYCSRVPDLHGTHFSN